MLCEGGTNICFIEILPPGKSAMAPGYCYTGREKAPSNIHRQFLTARLSLHNRKGQNMIPSVSTGIMAAFEKERATACGGWAWTTAPKEVIL